MERVRLRWVSTRLYQLLICECSRTSSPPVDGVLFTAPRWFARVQLDALQEAAGTAGVHVPELLENAGAGALRAATNLQQCGS